MGFPVELGERFEHHGPGGHVDAQGQGLGGEDHSQESLGEQFLGGFLQGGDHSRVVGGHSHFQAFQPFRIVESLQVLVGEMGGVGLGHRTDCRPLIGMGQSDSDVHHRRGGRFASRPGKNEINGGQQIVEFQGFHHLVAAGRGEPAMIPSARQQTHNPRVGLFAITASDESGKHAKVLWTPAVEDGVEVAERHRSAGCPDQAGGSSALGDPSCELRGVSDRGRKAHHLKRRRSVNDDLFPHRSAGPVGQIVHLVQDGNPHSRQASGVGVEHVAEHLGGHHHHRRLSPDGVVAGEKPHHPGSVMGGQVVVFLVGERLDGCGVVGAQALGQGQVDGDLGHQGLSRSGGGGDHHVGTGFERLGGFGLKMVGFEGETIQISAADRRRGHFLSTRRTSQ